jgi:hypothetical protein
VLDARRRLTTADRVRTYAFGGGGSGAAITERGASIAALTTAVLSNGAAADPAPLPSNTAEHDAIAWQHFV